MKIPDNFDLLAALKAGDPDAFAYLFDQYADRIYRLAMGILQNSTDSEDVVQETFLKAISNLDRFEGRSNLGTWLYRVAYNSAIDQTRKKFEFPIQEEAAEDEQDSWFPMPENLIEWSTPEIAMLNDEELALLDENISQLPEPLRIVFQLRDIEELSVRETAEVLGISTSLVKVRLHRARLLLREKLSEYFAERKMTTE